MSGQAVEQSLEGSRFQENGALARMFIELVQANPACRSSYRAALLAADAPIECDALADVIASAPHPATFIQSPQNVVTTLVRAGVLSQIVLIDGAPYDGSPEDLFDDDTVPDDAEVTYLVQLTDAGALALAEMAPEKRVRELLRQKPSYTATFLKVIEMTAQPGGAEKESIEKQIYQDRDALRLNQRTHLPSIYPVYYLNALEEAGAIQWNADRAVWMATDAGRAALA